MGVLGTHFISGTLKTCSSTSPEVRAALHEMGHVTRSWGKTRSGHFNHAVLTSDAGWISVDPTFMQFYCQYQLDEEDDEEALVPMFMHFRDILEDPLNAFEIEQLPDRPGEGVPEQVPPMPYAPAYGGENWVEYNQNRARYAVRSLEAAAGRGRMRNLPWYADLMVELGLYE